MFVCWIHCRHHYPGRPGRPGRPDRPYPRVIPHIFFHDGDYDHEIVDFGDLMDIYDIDTGEQMIAMPSNWTDLTLIDVNDGTFSFA